MNGGENVLILGEAMCVFLRDTIVIDPHRELASPTLHELGLDTNSRLDQRRHTGRARTIVSDLAVSNLNGLHEDASVINAPRRTTRA